MTARDTTGAFALSPADIDASQDEPRIKDVRVGQRLGMARPTDIRRVIDANRLELERYGSLRAVRAMIAAGKGAQRETLEYYLNEAQTILLCMFSRTARAADVRQEVISVYTQWRAQRQGAARGGADVSAEVIAHTVRAVLAEMGYGPQHQGTAPARGSAPARGAVPTGELFAAPQPVPDVAGVEDFLRACTRPDPKGRIQAAPLHAAYAAWCQRVGKDAMTQTAFGRVMFALGITRATAKVRFYLGLRLCNPSPVPHGRRGDMLALFRDVASVGHSGPALYRVALYLRGDRARPAKGTVAGIYADAAEGKLKGDIYRLVVAVVRDGLAHLEAILDDHAGQSDPLPPFLSQYRHSAETFAALVAGRYGDAPPPPGSSTRAWQIECALMRAVAAMGMQR
jgi:hypothetical protein